MTYKKIIFAILISILFVNCDQYAIFYTISNEVKPKDPRIQGHPSKILRQTNGGETHLYLSNGEYSPGKAGVWEYTVSGDNWRLIAKQPSNFIRDIAALDDRLFVITEESNKNKGDPYIITRVYAYSNSETDADWEKIEGIEDAKYSQNTSGDSGGKQYQALFCAGGELFISISSKEYDNDSPAYSVYILREGSDPPLAQIGGISGIFNGALQAGGAYYLASDTGFWKWDGTDANSAVLVKNTDDGDITANIAGIIAGGRENTDDIEYAAAFTVNGAVYLLPLAEKNARYTSFDLDRFTGALAIWEGWNGEGYSGTRRILAGVDLRDNVGYGYREFEVKDDWTVVMSSWSGSISIENSETDSTTIGTHSLNSIAQVSNYNKFGDPPKYLPVMFASTEQSGLFSFRLRGDKDYPYWEGEE